MTRLSALFKEYGAQRAQRTLRHADPKTTSEMHAHIEASWAGIRHFTGVTLLTWIQHFVGLIALNPPGADELVTTAPGLLSIVNCDRFVGIEGVLK